MGRQCMQIHTALSRPKSLFRLNLRCRLSSGACTRMQLPGAWGQPWYGLEVGLSIESMLRLGLNALFPTPRHAFYLRDTDHRKRMEARMQPRSDGYQRCLHFALTPSPSARVMMYQDHDGNTVHFFDIPARHARLTLTAEALVECRRRRCCLTAWVLTSGTTSTLSRTRVSAGSTDSERVHREPRLCWTISRAS